MALNVVDVQDAILEHLKDEIPQRVVEQAIPDTMTVLRDESNVIRPYVAVQFGDPQYVRSGRTFASVRTHDYDLMVYVQALAGTPRDARIIAYGKVMDALLGFKSDWTGEVRKRPGGGMWPILSTSGAIEAYMSPASFAVRMQMAEGEA